MPGVSSAKIAPEPPPVTMTLVDGTVRRAIVLDHSPFSVGRLPDRDIVFSDRRVSREHAVIVREADKFTVVDQNSRRGTFVNGERVKRHELARGDRLEFGGQDGAYLIFDSERATAQTLLTQISRIHHSSASSDLEKLTVFLEIARKLNSTYALEEILSAIIEATLRLTHAERGYIFLRQPDGSLHLATGMNAFGEPLRDDSALSRSVLQDAAESASEFLVTDTHADSGVRSRQSIVKLDLRTVIAIPLREPRWRGRAAREAGGEPVAPVTGVLYLDSRLASGGLSTISHDILHAIAAEAAAVVHTARLAEAEEEARRYEQELAIAASIQQRLMAVSIPRVEFAEIHARSLACRAIGGDFFDVVSNERGIALVVTDVSGKGVSAAILASTLQGMIYSQLLANVPIGDIARSVNRYLCQKSLDERYATLVILLLSPEGEAEYVNCGHIAPLQIGADGVRSLGSANFPVGWFETANYDTGRIRLAPGESLLLVTDGVTEAENAFGEMFGSARMEEAASAVQSAAATVLDSVFSALDEFRGRVPLGDDCTAVELKYLAAR